LIFLEEVKRNRESENDLANKNLEIPYGVWNSFGLQMDFDSPLEGRFEEKVEEEDKKKKKKKKKKSLF
jgi:hypothetical protein